MLPEGSPFLQSSLRKSVEACKLDKGDYIHRSQEVQSSRVKLRKLKNKNAKLPKPVSGYFLTSFGFPDDFPLSFLLDLGGISLIFIFQKLILI